jgi:hypothetical protein
MNVRTFACLPIAELFQIVMRYNLNQNQVQQTKAQFFQVSLVPNRDKMSQAFVRESEEQWLHEVPPTLPALIVYLTRENNGIRVYEQKCYPHPAHGRDVHLMSNGLSYAKDGEGRWYIEW